MTRTPRKLICVAMLAGLLGPGSLGGAQADTLELEGSIRDFRTSHPDMEAYPETGMRNIVDPRLGEDGNPQLNLHYHAGRVLTLSDGPTVTVGFLRDSVHISSNRLLSTVILRLDDGSLIRWNHLGHRVGHTGVFDVPERHSGRRVIGAWVVSDGRGQWFPIQRASKIHVPVTSVESFAQWFQDVEGVNKPIKHTIRLDNGRSEPGGIYRFARERPTYFFPIDDKGFGLTPSTHQWPLVWAPGDLHNFHFTFELHTKFTYTDPAERDYDLIFRFTGDDDVWVYINNNLAVDLGGVHPQISGEVNLDDMAQSLELEPGQTYPLDFFFAERHTSESNFKIETTLQLTNLDPLYD